MHAAGLARGARGSVGRAAAGARAARSTFAGRAFANEFALVLAVVETHEHRGRVADLEARLGAVQGAVGARHRVFELLVPCRLRRWAHRRRLGAGRARCEDDHSQGPEQHEYGHRQQQRLMLRPSRSLLFWLELDHRGRARLARRRVGREVDGWQMKVGAAVLALGSPTEIRVADRATTLRTRHHQHRGSWLGVRFSTLPPLPRLVHVPHLARAVPSPFFVEVEAYTGLRRRFAVACNSRERPRSQASRRRALAPTRRHAARR